MDIGDDKELEIDNSSVWRLEQELLAHPKKEAKYYRWRAEAVKNVDRLTLQLEMVVAEIMGEAIEKERRKGRTLTPFTLDNLRKVIEKTELPLDKRYQIVKNRLIKAKETAGILEGLVKAWEGRGYRLSELAKLAETMHFPEPRILRNPKGSVEFNLYDASKKLDIE